MKTTILDNMINKFREAENLYLEARTEMADHPDWKRQRFMIKASLLKEEASKTMNWLRDTIGIEEEYINDLLTSEGI